MIWDDARMRIGFLFNHDQVHQVAHGLPIALALAARRSGAEIILASGSDRITREIRTLAGEALKAGPSLVELKLARRSSRLAHAIGGRLVPSSKLLVYRDNLDFFKSLDLLVVPEKTSLLLKDHFGLGSLKIVHTRHGAGDRAIGFNKASARFDHVLAAGPKIRDRLVRDAGVAPERISIVGYPKFDLFGLPEARPPAERPLVVYNPHVAPHLSSWYKSGRAILRWFAASPSFQLVFAPHIMLFERKLVLTVQPPRLALPGSVQQRSFDPGKVLVDTRSRALTTMEYLNRADIYLGDASSQVYEFLAQPRPCIFFDAHGFEFENDPNFAHWQAGRVIRRVDALGDALSSAFEEHAKRYRAVQQEMVRYTFDLGPESASDRAADAILEVAGATLAKEAGERGRRRRSPAKKPPLAAAAHS